MALDPATAPWWTRATVHQVDPRSFADANGDGVGDLRGVLAHLDHLDARIAALHERGMELILDVVLNHTSDAHPRFQAARRSPDERASLRGWEARVYRL